VIQRPEPYPELRAALAALVAEDPDHAGVQNRRGFNGGDSEFGHSLHRQQSWSGRQAFAAYRMLRKYHGQLIALGVDVEKIPEPKVMLEPHGPGGTAPAPRQVSFISESARFRVTFTYSGPLVAAIKRVDGRRFDIESKSWLVPLAGAEQLQAFADAHDFVFTPRAAAAMHEMALRREASRATDADLDIPGLVGELRPFQRAGVQFLLRAKRAILADDPGLGKTCQAIATIHAANAYPALIVVPASLKLNWRKEIKQWLPGATVEILSGRTATNPMFQGYVADFVVANYDVISARLEDLKDRGFKSIVFDESHALKTRSAQRSVAAKELARGKEIRLLLSGTPILNRPKELINQLEIINQLDNLGGWHDFNSKYVGAAGTTILQELNKRLRSICMIRRLKSSVLSELPEKQQAIVPIELSNRREYMAAQADLISWLRATQGDEAARKARGAEALVRISKLRLLAAQGKLSAATAWISDFLDSGQALVAFAHHREIQKQLVAAFPGCAYLLGDDDIASRDTQVSRFQNDPACRLIVCSLKAGGVGITLTKASNVAFLEQGWNMAEMSQATDRVHRIGQRDSVTAWWLLAEDSIDQMMSELILSKAAAVDAATEGRVMEETTLLNSLISRLIA
jgi:SWI/SNF-related matrix-associated actin-dependent regulator 1 of chromatin subfamily A